MARQDINVTFAIDDELCRRIDQFAKLGDGKALNRSEAIRQLVKLGLEAVAQKEPQHAA